MKSAKLLFHSSVVLYMPHVLSRSVVLPHQVVKHVACVERIGTLQSRRQWPTVQAWRVHLHRLVMIQVWGSHRLFNIQCNGPMRSSTCNAIVGTSCLLFRMDSGGTRHSSWLLFERMHVELGVTVRKSALLSITTLALLKPDAKCLFEDISS